MIIEWLITNVTYVVSPDRADCDILGMVLDVFWPLQADFVGDEPLCGPEIASRALKTLL